MKLPQKNLEEFDKEFLSKITLSNSGDGYEQDFWFYINQRLPNYEQFWQKHIIPLTKRIELPFNRPDRIKPRDSVDKKLIDISEVHYSVFMNLIQAYKRLTHRDLSWFEDFYTHLVSSCDLAEDFWLKICLLISECTDTTLTSNRPISEDECKKQAPIYYERYKKNYKYFQENRGMKPIMISVPDVDKIIKEFFNGDNSSGKYKNYKKFSQKIKEYRNVIIHHPQIGKNIILYGNTNFNIAVELVPKKEKIKEYIHWRQIEDALKDTHKLENDFIQIEKQMESDIKELEIVFNNLWEVILQKMEALRDKPNYLKLQDIEFSDNNDQNSNTAKLKTPLNRPPITHGYFDYGLGSNVSITSHPLSAMTEKDMRKKQ